jgi:hypothetical protein
VLADHDLQAELAAAFREQADPVTAAPIDSAGIFQRAVHRRRRRRVAVRAGSVLAVLAVVVAGASVGASVLSRAGRPVPGHAGQPPGLLLDAAVAAAPSASAAVSRMPPYYVTADHGRPVAEVRDSATGKVLSVIPLPAGIDPKMTEATAAGNDRTFVLALFFSRLSRTRFYLMRVAAGGHSARLAPLAIPGLPAGAVADAIAVSADGRRLAVSVQFSGGRHGAVEVASLGTGAVRWWTTGQAGLPEDLSWANGGRELGFFWQDTGPTGGLPRTSASGLWRLDTTVPGTNLLSGRRILPEFEGGDDVQSAVLTPDGNRVIASVTYAGVGHVGRGTVVGGIAELSARTGRPLRTLLAEHASPSDPSHPGWAITPCILVAADATGNHLLVSCDRFGRLDHARFTALPGAAPQTAIAAAW